MVDAGSLEHVFDVPTAIRNCMRMVAPGGYFLAITPANNTMGHGFYQFSPELFYRVLSDANGFTVERMLVTGTSSTRWFEVADPASIGGPRAAPRFPPRRISASPPGGSSCGRSSTRRRSRATTPRGGRARTARRHPRPDRPPRRS